MPVLVSAHLAHPRPYFHSKARAHAALADLRAGPLARIPSHCWSEDTLADLQSLAASRGLATTDVGRRLLRRCHRTLRKH